MSLIYDADIPYDSPWFRYDGLEVVGDWMAEFNGIVLGGDGPYGITGVEGLADQPDMVTSDRGQLRRDGMTPGDDFLGGRSIVVGIEVTASEYVTFNEAMSDLQRALSPGIERGMVFQIPGVAQGERALVLCRPRKRKISIDQTYGIGKLAYATVEFFATDPRVYLAEIETASSGLPSNAGGMTFPMTFPLTFGASASGGTVLVDNQGTYSTPVVFRLDGPVTNPRISNLTTGQTLDLTIDIVAGDHLILDSRSRAVLLNSTASRYLALTGSSDWFDLAPGVNEITFRAETSTPSTLGISFRSAWV